MAYSEFDLAKLIEAVGLTPADPLSTGDWYTASEAATRLNISRQAIHNAIKRDSLPAIRLTHNGEVISVIIRKQDLENYRRSKFRKTG